MANVWDAEVEIDQHLAAEYLTDQFPQFAGCSVTLLGAGWDNLAILVDDRFVFRFPRRKMGAELLATEIDFLPTLAKYLPIAIPVPDLVGSPNAKYPYPFAGYPMIHGFTACRVDWTEETRASLAEPIAHF